MKIKISDLRKLINEEISGRLIKRNRSDFEERNARNVLDTVDRRPEARRFDRPLYKKPTGRAKKITVVYEIPDIDIDFTVSNNSDFSEFPLRLEVSLNEHKDIKNDVINKFEKVTDVGYDIIKYNMLYEINNRIIDIFNNLNLNHIDASNYTDGFSVDDIEYDVLYEYYDDGEMNSVKMYFSEAENLKSVLKRIYFASKNGIID